MLGKSVNQAVACVLFLSLRSILTCFVVVVLLPHSVFLSFFFCSYDRSYKERSTFCAKFVYPFLSGAVAAGIATTMTQPFDVIKTNIQGVDYVFRRRGAYYKANNGFASVAATVSLRNGT